MRALAALLLMAPLLCAAQPGAPVEKPQVKGVRQVKRWVKHVYQDVQLEVVEELYFYRVQ